MESSQSEVPCREGAELAADQIKRLTRAMRFIQANFASQPRLPEIAKIAGLSPFHFHRLFHKCYGRTVKQVMTSLQVEYAQELLKTGMSAAEAGRRSGFANQSHFTSRFREMTGTTPAAWRRAFKKARAQDPNAQIVR
jgi:AraC-like DNA-binding protein